MLENVGKKSFEMLNLCSIIMACKSMKDAYVLKTPVTEQRLKVRLTSMHITVDDPQFL